MTTQIGIKNPGTLCYVNSCLHLLHKVDTFRQAVLSLDLEDCSDFLISFRNLFVALDAGQEAPNPTNLFSLCQYEENSVSIQHDAREFLEFILRKLDSEFKEMNMPNLENLVENTFLSFTKETTTAIELVEPVYNSIAFFIFILNTRDSTTFEDALTRSLYSNYEYRISKETARPPVYVDAEKQIQFSILPPVLICSFNRLYMNEKNDGGVKDQRKISFPFDLDLAAFTALPNGNEQYFIFSIIAHCGTINGGHFTFYTRDENYDDWLLFNDSNVSKVSEKEIKELFGPGISRTVSPKSKSKPKLNFHPVAYQLIYIKRSSSSEIAPNLTIPVSTPSPTPAPVPAPTPAPPPDDDEENREERTREELEKFAKNSMGEMFEIVGDLVTSFSYEQWIKWFEEFLHKRIKFPELCYAPKFKVNREIILEPDAKEIFDAELDEEISEELTAFCLPEESSDSDVLIENSNSEVMKELGKVVDIQDQDSLPKNLLRKIQIDLLKNKNSWTKTPDFPLFPGICRSCKKPSDECWIIQAEGLNFLCNECRLKEQPRAKKAPLRDTEGETSGGKEKAKKKKKKKQAPQKDSNGGKPFKCQHSGCEREFARKPDLKKHQLVHTSERPFKCGFPGCDASCKSKWDLKTHQRAHSTARPYKCGFPGCDKAFKTKSQLNHHRRVHSTARPFKCGFPGCDKAFKSTSDLKKHQRAHSTARPYKCHLCNKSFHVIDLLRRHEKGPRHVAKEKANQSTKK